MSPCLSSRDVADGGARYVKCYSQLAFGDKACCVEGPNPSHLGCRELHIPVEFTVRMAALLHAIGFVGERSAKEQVVRINAVPDVALVADKEAIWDWAVGQLPGDAVNLAILLAVFDGAVTVRIQSPHPQPACFGSHCSKRETFSEWD